MKKMKTILISTILLLLFLGSFSVKSSTLNTLNYPSTVKVGRTFEIEVIFVYDGVKDAIYGEDVWLIYDVGPEPNVYTNYDILTVEISDSNNLPKPVNAIIVIDTTDYNAGDIFQFKVRYFQGVIINDILYRGNPLLTDVGEVRIVSNILPIWSIPLIALGGLLVIAVPIIFIVKKSR